MLTADTSTAAAWAAARDDIDEAALERMAMEVRRSVVTMVDRAGLGHIGGDLSVTDILVTLFGAVLDVDPTHPDREDRDRFILSKGHCAGALYATLAHCGFFAKEELETFMTWLREAWQTSMKSEFAERTYTYFSTLESAKKKDRKDLKQQYEKLLV